MINKDLHDPNAYALYPTGISYAVVTAELTRQERAVFDLAVMLTFGVWDANEEPVTELAIHACEADFSLPSVPLSTQDVAEELGWSLETAQHCIMRLIDRGLLAQASPGSLQIRPPSSWKPRPAEKDVQARRRPCRRATR